jgi:hypothetical protein
MLPGMTNDMVIVVHSFFYVKFQHSGNVYIMDRSYNTKSRTFLSCNSHVKKFDGCR